MSQDSKICKNPDCNKPYVVDGVDDGYCTFSCWEKMSCNTEKSKNVNFFDMSDVLVMSKAS